MAHEPDQEWIAWSQKYLAKHEAEKPKRQAQAKVALALKKGLLRKDSGCGDCWVRGIRTPKVQAHHEDYTKPLEVLWLCATCHRRRHLKLAISTT